MSFASFGFAQWTMLALLCLQFFCALLLDGSKRSNPNWSFAESGSAAVIVMLLLYIGGFWK